MNRPLAERIDALLPQTQCGRCGYDRCRPYAEALACGEAALNRCPPGGRATIDALATLLQTPRLELDPRCGVEAALAVAVIDESECIGCTLCIQACPVDAIVGAAKRMHTVVASLCSGCERCVAPCPVDCISMLPPEPPRAWAREDAADARARMQARDRRLDAQRRMQEARQALRADDEAHDAMADPCAPEADRRPSGIAALVAAAIERARSRRAARSR
jgi:Na+-translocating ferredoxin:NAD+ oxidoreductase subunit B